MDRDKGKFYEDERPGDATAQDQQSGQRPAQEEEINDMVYFLETLKNLRVTIESGRSVPLTDRKIVDAHLLLTMISDLENNLPDAVQYGMQMFSERDRLMGRAEEESVRIVSSAEMRASAALEKAKSTAEQIVADAENEARAIIADAEDRADHMVEESEVLRRAKEDARITVNDARVEAREILLKANHDAYSILRSVEDELNESLKAVRQQCAKLDGDNA